MKKIVMTALLAGGIYGQAIQAQLKDKVIISTRPQAQLTVKPALAVPLIQIADLAKAAGRNITETEMVKTISGKEITMKEYLRRLNALEASMNQKGYSIRNLKLTNANMISSTQLSEARITQANLQINSNVRPLMTTQSRTQKIFVHQAGAGQQFRASAITLSSLAFASLKGKLGSAAKAETIEEVKSIKDLLKPLSDKIQAELGDDASFDILNAELVVKSFAEPPKNASGLIDPAAINGTNSEYKVAVSFNANMKVAMGLPVTLTLPIVTMNGEFVSPSNSSKKLVRKVVVNLVGKSLFNKTSQVNGNTLEEEDDQELDISELLPPVGLNAANFMDWIPTVKFNLSLSTQGAVGCSYKADMTRTNVDAFIGPTYSVRLRAAASYGFEDMLEGGIEGIITLLKGSVGFGGNAGLDYTSNTWKLVNTTFVESQLEALQGEVNFFVRYPDFGNWSCGGPCIRKDTYPMYKTPVAFKLHGTLYDKDRSKDLAW